MKGAVEKFPMYKDHTYSIIINNEVEIKIPVVVAASISSKISEIIENDPTSSKLPITLNECSSESLGKIKKVVLKNENVELDKEEDINAFASFGLAIGNDDFISPLNKKLSKEMSSMTNDNVVSILKTKKVFSIKDTKEETKFIAKNFNDITCREDFLLFAKNSDNIDVIEEIVSSNDLSMENEDNLLSFILSLCKSAKEKEEYFTLFSHLFLEYCSVQKCEEFLEFVKESMSSESMRVLFSCIGRRLLQKEIPMKPNYIINRHTYKMIYSVNTDDPLNGIFRRENQNNNVLLEPSTTGNDNVYKIIKADDSSNFRTENIENSFINASLKDGKVFVIKNYMLRGNLLGGSEDKVKNWILEGQKSNGDWIQLDHRENVSFDKLQVKTFDVSNREKLKAVKITMKGKNASDTYSFRINAFDIFGDLYEPYK